MPHPHVVDVVLDRELEVEQGLERQGDVRYDVGVADLELKLPAEALPIGVHRLRWTVRGGEERESTLLVAPQRFPVSAARREGPHRPELALFSPVYTVWSEQEPLPIGGGGVKALRVTPVSVQLSRNTSLPQMSQFLYCVVLRGSS